MAIQYRPWREGDDLELLQVWGGPDNQHAEQSRSLFRPSTDLPWLRCIVAEDSVDGAAVLVAAGYVFEARLHNQRLWAYVEVGADHRRAGIGSTILGMLQHEARESPSGVSALRNKVVPGSAGAAFAEAADLTEIQRSRIIEVAPGALPVQNLADDDGPQLEEAATGSVELTSSVAEWYNAVHEWDPANMTLGQAQQYLLADIAGAGGAVVLRDQPKAAGGNIAAFALSYTQSRTDAPADVLVGYDTTLPEREQQAAVATLLAMLVYQYPVQVEVDDAMTALVNVIEPLLAQGSAKVLAETRIVST